jgi:hypothetical protein
VKRRCPAMLPTGYRSPLTDVTFRLSAPYTTISTMPNWPQPEARKEGE